MASQAQVLAGCSSIQRSSSFASTETATRRRGGRLSREPRAISRVWRQSWGRHHRSATQRVQYQCRTRCRSTRHFSNQSQQALNDLIERANESKQTVEYVSVVAEFVKIPLRRDSAPVVKRFVVHTFFSCLAVILTRVTLIALLQVSLECGAKSISPQLVLNAPCV